MQVLDLPKTRISLHPEELVKYGPADVAIARYPTDRIVAIGLEKSREVALPIVLTSVFASLALVAYRYVSSPGWSWTGVIVSLGICGVVLASMEGRKVVIETTNGTVRYPVADLFEEAEGFVVSVNAMLGLDGIEAGGREEEKELAAIQP